MGRLVDRFFFLFLFRNLTTLPMWHPPYSLHGRDLEVQEIITKPKTYPQQKN